MPENASSSSPISPLSGALAVPGTRAWPIWVLAGVIVAAAAHSYWKIQAHVDLDVFHVAAERALRGQPLYPESDGIMPFKYAPVVALLLAPLGLLPQAIRTPLWLLATALLLLRFFWVARSLVAPKLGAGWVCAAAFLVFPFFFHILRLGQIDILILALAAESERLRTSRPRLSGILLGLCSAIKLPFLLLPLLAVANREWKRVGAFVTAALALTLAPVLRYGWEGNLNLLAQWRAILALTTPPFLCTGENQSVFGIACQYFSTPGQPLFRLAAFGIGAVLVLVLGAAVYRASKQDRVSLSWVCAIYLTAVLSPLGWRANLVAMAPLFFLALDRLNQGKRRWGYLVFVPAGINALVGLVSFELLGPHGFHAFIHARLFGLLAMAAVVGMAFAAAAKSGLSTEQRI